MSAHDPVDSDLPAESGEDSIVSEAETEAELVEEELDPLALAERQRDDYLDQLRRLAAEFDNYKKRMAREHE